MAKLTRFLHPYYVINTALVLSWLVLRQIVDIRPLMEIFRGAFVSGELALFGLMTLYLYKKFKRCNTWDSFLAKSFMFYQALVIIMLFYVSTQATVWYTLACVASFFMFRVPPGGTSANIVELDDISFEQHIASQAKSKKPNGVAWLVFFTANWHSECTFFSYVFADMADKFGGTDTLKFGRIDDRYKAVFDSNQVWQPFDDFH